MARETQNDACLRASAKIAMDRAAQKHHIIMRDEITGSPINAIRIVTGNKTVGPVVIVGSNIMPASNEYLEALS